MSFSRSLLTRRTEQAPPRFTLVEDIALPLALCVMEAQPIAMVIAWLILMSGNALARAPLGVGEVILLLLGLLWWAMILAALKARGSLHSSFLQMGLRLCSLLGAWLVAALPHLSTLGNEGQDVVLVGEVLLIVWLWQRSLGRARLGFAYEPLTRSFQIGLGVLLVVMLLALAIQPASVLLPTLEASLTIFFLSGLVTLSLARLGIIRQVRTVNGKQADPTRSWVGALLLFSGGLIGVVFALEAVFSFSSFLWLLHALQPLWDGLGTLVGWLLYALIFLVLAPLFDGFSWLIGLVRGHGQSQPQNQPTISPFIHLTHTQHTTQLPPALLQIGKWGVLAVIGLLLLILVGASLRRWFLPYEAQHLEETREPVERLPRPPKRPRTRGRPRRLTEALASARAYYRLLLHTVEHTHPALARQPAETPLEYEQRLATQDGLFDPDPENPSAAASQDARTLATLTHAYMDERYGQQPLTVQDQSSLQQKMPHLLHLLTSKARAERNGSNP